MYFVVAYKWNLTLHIPTTVAIIHYIQNIYNIQNLKHSGGKILITKLDSVESNEIMHSSIFYGLYTYIYLIKHLFLLTIYRQ